MTSPTKNSYGTGAWHRKLIALVGVHRVTGAARILTVSRTTIYEWMSKDHYPGTEYKDAIRVAYSAIPRDLSTRRATR